MSIWDKLIDFDTAFEKRCNDSIARHKAAIKRKTSGPRWRPIKAILGGLTVAGMIALILSYWGIVVLIFIISVILGLAAKS